MPKDAHNKAAEHHEKAAKSHRDAAQQHGSNDHAKGKQHRRRPISTPRLRTSILMKLTARASSRNSSHIMRKRTPLRRGFSFGTRRSPVHCNRNGG
jgi:hypothetical protein